MKKYIPSAIGFLIGLSLIIGGFAANKPPAQNETPCFEIIKDTTDDRGLISIVITDGIDTFAYDYLNRSEYDSIFK